MGLYMQVQVVDDKGEVIWMRGDNIGISCRRYLEDGTQEQIINILKEGLFQAQGELSCSNNIDRIPDVCCTSS